MASGIVNIRRDVDDKFYRYRMPVLLTKIEGKGNGIKTVISNMSDVARALSRPPTYPTKFFGCELGALCTFDEKADKYIVNGAHSAERLRELLDVFIEKFVLCGSCKNPETDLILTKTEDIYRDCKACGQRTGIDMRHKLTTFIIRNPPKVAKGKKAKGAHATADTTGNGVGNGAKSPDRASDGSGNGSDEDELTKRIKADAAELPTAEQAHAANGGEEWSLDTSPEAVRARRTKTLESTFQSALVIGDGGDDSEGEDADSPYAQIRVWAEENRAKASPADVYKKTVELGIEKKHKTVQALVQGLFTADMPSEIEKFSVVFKKMTTSEKHQKSLLGGIERFVGVDHPELIPSIPKILMVFYQDDILEESVVQQWGTHVSKKYVDKDTSKKVRKASEPFLKWLEEAEDEEDE